MVSEEIPIMNNDDTKLPREIDLVEKDEHWHELLQSLRQLMPDDIDEKIFVDVVKTISLLLNNIKDNTKEASNFMTINTLETLASSANLKLNDIINENIKKSFKN
jgi:hypothetical protein